jgi:hypothetical protein
MTDSLLKVGSVVVIVRKCKDIVNALKYKSDMLEREVKDTNNEIAARNLLEKMKEVQSIEDNDVMLTDEEGQTETGVTEMEIETEDRQRCSNANKQSKTLQDGSKHVYRLKNEMPTRWNSCLAMMRSLLQMRKEVDNCVKMIGQYEKCLKSSEWAIVEELAAFPSHFEDFTEIVSTKVTSLSVIQLIRSEIQDITITTANDCEEVAALKRLVGRNLDGRLPLTDAALLATLLDPSTKDLVAMDHVGKLELLVKAVADFSFGRAPVVAQSVSSSLSSPVDQVTLPSSDSGTAEADNELRSISKRRRLLQKHRVEIPMDDAIRAEVNTYLQMKVDAEADEDPLLFWKNASQLDRLKPLAKMMLTRSASSVDVECMFSTTGLILNGKRSSLSAQSADKLSFIHDNFFLLPSNLTWHNCCLKSYILT